MESINSEFDNRFSQEEDDRRDAPEALYATMVSHPKHTTGARGGEHDVD